jgi:hypothetical protein
MEVARDPLGAGGMDASQIKPRARRLISSSVVSRDLQPIRSTRPLRQFGPNVAWRRVALLQMI